MAAEDEDQHDTSKPTNLFSSLGNNLEFSDRKNGNTWGYRGTLNWAIDADNLLLVEVPVLHNNSTGKTGLGDSRLRYFHISYKDYSKFFGVFAFSIDATLPTGDINDGLGSDRTVLAPAIAAGLMLAPWIQTFPIVSYVYTSSTDSVLVAAEDRGSKSGFSIQAITPVVINDEFWVSYTPIYTQQEFGGSSTFSHEFVLNYRINSEFQMQFFTRQIPKIDLSTYRINLQYFF
jgi:hypothetical protein